MKVTWGSLAAGALAAILVCLLITGIVAWWVCIYGAINPGTVEIILRDPTPVEAEEAPLAATPTTPSQFIIRGTVLKADGSSLGDVSLWLLRDTGNGYVTIAAKPVNPDGAFAFYVSPVKANYSVKVVLPYGYEMIGPSQVYFSWDKISFLEFRAVWCTPTPESSPTPPVPPTLTPGSSATPASTSEPSPTPSETVLELSAMARMVISEEVYWSWASGELPDPYSAFTETVFWKISQIDHQLGLPFTPIKQIFVQDVEYCAVGFLCEILVVRADDTTRFAVVDYNGVQLNH